MKSRSFQVFAAVLLGCCGLVPLATIAAKPGGGGSTGPTYTIVPLDNAGGLYDSYAGDIQNSTGLVVGNVHNTITGESSSAYWTITKTSTSVQSTLNFLAGGGNASGVNDLGGIVGSVPVGGAEVGLYWTNKDAAAIALPRLPGESFSWARSINREGVICGVSAVVTSNGQTRTAVAWRVSAAGVKGPFVLAPAVPGDSTEASAVRDMDATGNIEVVGASNQSAMVWTVRFAEGGGLTLVDADMLDAVGYATGVNGSGVVCGRDGANAVLWGATTQVLAVDRSFSPGSPQGVNNSGVVVGSAWKLTGDTRAIVWPSPTGPMTPLDKFLTAKSPFSYLQSANAVNSAGEIIGHGWSGATGLHQAFMAIPNK